MAENVRRDAAAAQSATTALESEDLSLMAHRVMRTLVGASAAIGLFGAVMLWRFVEETLSRPDVPAA